MDVKAPPISDKIQKTQTLELHQWHRFPLLFVSYPGGGQALSKYAHVVGTPPLNKVKSRALNLCNGCLCASPSPFSCDM
jgi:hypothetical protein